ncbi:DUF3592 domain-containing protein [Chloroflexus sp. MS-CIW-1]|jgi:hypothetical protein|uniref:DUF3592 domain-containing protein n=1 Tax=unclassified Chloroflexus TaxID=2633855 RepID=UPI0004DFA7BB|nr:MULTISPECIES: DUF3592 domain-containing protein [unclassified Chloroflexus]MDN5270800.1 DUF3592 domain-containing protein [Chloroflexus sp. MS-CIW-1]
MSSRPLSRTGALLIGLTFTVIGLVVLFIGLFWLNATSERLKRMIDGTGTVVEVTRRRIGDDINYYPRIEFQTQTGETFQFESNTGGSSTSYRVGDQVLILYDPQMPQDATINSWYEIWLPPIVVTILSLSGLAPGMFALGLALFAKS